MQWPRLGCDCGDGKDKLGDVKGVGETGVSDYLGSRRMEEKEALRMALGFLSDVGWRT